MTTYVLVHGAWSGAHSWRRLRPLLAGAGHAVFTPSLTGLGERAHLISPQVDLTMHVLDVVNHVVYEDLRDVVLVGHSYGGAVVTGALDHIADRVRHLVFLDAFVPAHGESVATLAGGGLAPLLEPPAGSAPDEQTPTREWLTREWLIPPSPRDFGDPAEQAWSDARRRPHPVRCLTEPVVLRRPLEEHDLTLTYVKATAEPESAPGNAAFWAAARHAAESPRWAGHEIATTHVVQHHEPEALAALLLALG
jgi:pimeloyl-ACP methyl ester carboxylesterase